MWIDAHHHLWDPGKRPQPWMDPSWVINRAFSVEDLHNAVASTPVEATVVVQTVSSVEETAELLDFANANPLIVGVVGWLDLTNDIDHQLDRLVAAREIEHLVGVRHQAENEPDPMWLARDDIVAAVSVLGRHGLAYDLLVRPHQLPAAVELARATQDATRLIVDHCGKPSVGRDLSDWERTIRELAGYCHVACKLSGLVTEADWRHWRLQDLLPVVDVVLECFGPQRTMFGSDWPVCLLAASYDEVVGVCEALAAGLSAQEHEAVFAGTARRWYRLKRPPTASA